jgi:hypothetical protein
MKRHWSAPATSAPILLLIALVVFSGQFLCPWNAGSFARFARSIGIGTLVLILWWLWAGRTRTLDRLPSAEKDELRDVRRVKDFVLAFTAGAAAILIVFSLHHGSQFRNLAGLLGLSGLVAVASLITGATLGLLFGIPRANRERQASPGATGDSGATESTTREGGTMASASAPAAAKESAQPLFRSNTNLEEISDWLTKIIVGLGLAHLAQMPGYVRRLTAFVSRSGSVPGAEAFTPNVALAVMVAFGGCGFLLGYLMTRLFLQGALGRAESESRMQLLRLVDEAGSSAGSTAASEDRSSGAGRRSDASPLTESEVARAIRAETISKDVDARTLAAEIQRLAREYEGLRITRPPGAERTHAMERVVAQMRSLGRAAEPLLPQLMTSTSPGERLAAVSVLTMKPKVEALLWLADRIAHEAPFIGYHAAVALRAAVRVLPQHKAELKEAIDRGLAALASHTTTDRHEELLRAQRELDATPD